MTPSQTRRFAAIGGIVAAHLNESNGYTLSPDLDRDALARDIRDLARLGRTDRWRATVERWALMVSDDQSRTDLGHARWALVQGSTYAGWDAE